MGYSDQMPWLAFSNPVLVAQVLIKNLYLRHLPSIMQSVIFHRKSAEFSLTELLLNVSQHVNCLDLIHLLKKMGGTTKTDFLVNNCLDISHICTHIYNDNCLWYHYNWSTFCKFHFHNLQTYRFSFFFRSVIFVMRQ